MHVKLLITAVAASLAIAVTLTAMSQTTNPQAPPSQSPGTVTMIDLPVKVPAVGNLGAVKTWRLGRIESIERSQNEGEILLNIRVKNGDVLKIVAPGPPLADFAVASDWVKHADAKSLPGRKDWVERMIAFDVDETGRLIAMASLEPLNRNERRMWRAFEG
jgi:hypothetical protein